MDYQMEICHGVGMARSTILMLSVLELDGLGTPSGAILDLSKWSLINWRELGMTCLQHIYQT